MNLDCLSALKTGGTFDKVFQPPSSDYQNSGKIQANFSLGSIVNSVKSAGSKAFNAAKSVGSKVVSAVRNVGSKASSAVRTTASKAWNTVKSVGSAAVRFNH